MRHRVTELPATQESKRCRPLTSALIRTAALSELRSDARTARVLEAYALLAHQHLGSDLAALLHRGPHVARAEQHLRAFIRDLLSEGAASGEVRDDVAPEELASYCLHAVAAARGLPSKAAVQRLVTVILAGLQPPH